MRLGKRTLQALPWVAAACLGVGVLVFAYARDEVPLIAPMIMAAAFALGAIDLVWPTQRFLAGLLFRGLFFGTAIESFDAAFGNSAFDPAAALGLGAAYGLLTGLWELFSDRDRDTVTS